MKFKLRSLFIMLALLANVHYVAAQGTRFFRISGPAATKITSFRPDGTMVWTNAQTGTNYTIQTVSSLSGGTNWVDYVQIPANYRVNTNLLIAFNPPSGMALIPAGVFTMGDNLDGESDAPGHSVYVSAFYMDKYDVAKAQWDSVYQWATNQGYSFDNPGSGKAANHPVQTINWYSALKWCNARSEKEGLNPCYYTSTVQTTVFRSGQVSLTNACVNWAANGYRLPTEAEWEKAARAGLSGRRFPWGDTISWSLANYNSYWSGGVPYYSYDVNPTSGYNPTFATGGYPYTSPVDYFAPNGYGLSDMAGNIIQWCWDWYDGSWYSNAGATQTDTRGPTSPPNGVRVLRGGIWYYYPDYARCAFRNVNLPSLANNYIGFRCVRGF